MPVNQASYIKNTKKNNWEEEEGNSDCENMVSFDLQIFVPSKLFIRLAETITSL